VDFNETAEDELSATAKEGKLIFSFKIDTFIPGK